MLGLKNSLEMNESESGHLLENVASRFAVCLRSLRRPRTSLPEDVRCNENFPAASIVKVGIMSALLEDAAQGRCRLEDEVKISREQIVGGAGVLSEMEPGRVYSLAELCRLMMVVSDNTASNACLRQVGLGRLNSFFSSRGYQASVNRYFMSPVEKGKDNTMTAESAALMLADLYQGVGLNQELKSFALGCLRRQQYREKIPLLLPSELVVGHKTGELDGVRHDAAVIEADMPYLLVVFTAEGDKPWLVDRAIAQYSLQVYESRNNLLNGSEE